MNRWILISFLGLSLTGCGTETIRRITIKAAGYSLPFGSPSMTAQLCIQQVRFKTSSAAVGNQIVLAEFTPTLFTLDSLGATIGEATLNREGGFARVELDLKKDCTGSTTPAIDGTLTTPETFTSDLPITLVFESPTAFRSFDKSTLELNFQNFATVMITLNSTTTPADVRDALQAESGTY